MRKCSLQRSLLERKGKELDQLLENSISSTVIVEGKKDRMALEKLGFLDICTLNGRIDEFARELAERGVGEAIILTDLDRTGDRLCDSLKEALASHRIVSDSRARKRFSKLLNLDRFEEMAGKLGKFEVEMNELGISNKR